MDESITEDDRQAGAGRNQSLFREVNERLVETTPKGWAPPETIVCECAHETCFKDVSLSPEEYEAVRKNPRQFVVAPSDEHYLPLVERVVGKTDRFWVVEKFGQDAAVAEKFDPRSRSKPRLTAKS